MKQTFGLLSFVALSTFAVGGRIPPTCTQNHVAKYDDLHWEDPVETGNPIPSNYNGLDYDIFQVDQYDGFIIPASGNQYAMSFEGRGNISAHDNHSTFSLKSLSYSCSGGVPQPACAISMWGFRGRQLIAKRVLTFPALEPGHFPSEFVMNATVFDQRWSRLTSVGFANARADNGEMIYGGLMIDDLRYTLEGKCGSC
ncbi:hypothetical protein B0T16DRAFT_387715 [Cercophora newfieldiana]|uniref:Uncharacterized protein n=1 Tax=Cercophora newfieldiana TaxID=92897 RepID=A0AA39YGZ9_9PEZI|nr:hypothetical protein B0T16DRAFT_387715 [Cercophora newfieldiana]